MCGILFMAVRDEQSDMLVKFNESLSKLNNRGPDGHNVVVLQYQNYKIYMGFTRLAIRGLDNNGMQPFNFGKIHAICNGEIYNYDYLKEEYDIKVNSGSDCEIIPQLYDELGRDYFELNNVMDAEFAMVLFDGYYGGIYASRDRYGVRPLFYGRSDNIIMFSSEMKAMINICDHIEAVNPKNIYKFDLNSYNKDNNQFMYLSGLTDPLEKNINYTLDQIKININTILTNAVKKRLISDRPIGFFLSGGLDSSLIVAIATKLLGPENITCFTIGCENSPDVIAAEKVTDFLKIKKHYIIEFDTEEGLEELENVIYSIESYDTTTIRASTPQYILCKNIKEMTDIKVLLSGEGSDELHGSYRYFRDAPDKEEFETESNRLLDELYMFDNLRTDRTAASHGLEVRVPFLDFEYVNFIKSLDYSLLMNNKKVIEKKLLRDSFLGYLPEEILYRSKEAFSDAVSNSTEIWAKLLQKEANTEDNIGKYKINQPLTKEADMYRKIFNEFYFQDDVIKHYWMPRFQKKEITDPSATILDSY